MLKLEAYRSKRSKILFQSKTDIVMKGALDGLAARHKAFVQNIANAETPGYQPGDVHFEDQLRRIRDGLDGRVIGLQQVPQLKLAETLEDQSADRQDDNGVQIDTQVVRLEENTMTYEALSQATAIRGEMLRSAINEGRR
jgi:flagellar basal-body rod protein FlgB